MATGAKNILVLNAGSSSTKISLYQCDKNTVPQQAAWEKEIDFPAGSPDSVDWQKLFVDSLARVDTIDPYNKGRRAHDNMTASYKTVGAGIHTRPNLHIDIVGYRVVHGGAKYSQAVVIDDDVKDDIKDCIKLAPLHNKICLAQIEAMERLLPPSTKQIAVFDTAFHQTMPDVAKIYPVPYAWHEKYGIRRFGFHGINYQYCLHQAAGLLNKKPSSLSLIVCHLGAGCSLAAIENGKSVNTTMGFTPMDGLMMASRCGSVDPGILIYLLKNEKITVDEIDNELNKNSGLKGISQLSGDMKTIIDKMQTGNKNESGMAKLAFDMFIEHLRAGICAMRANLQKLDALVFTAGIGEHSSLVRQRACAGLDFLGLQLDEQTNQNSAGDHNIAGANSQTTILVIKAREDWEIARQCLLTMGSSIL